MINENIICETEKISVLDNMSYRLATAFISSEPDEDNEKAIVVGFRFYDQAGEIVNIKVDGLSLSHKYGYFLYSNFAGNNDEFISNVSLRFPAPVAHVQLIAFTWQAVGEITCSSLPRLIAKKQKNLFDKPCLYESDYIDVQAGATYRMAFADQIITGPGEPVPKAFVALLRFFDSQLQLCDAEGSDLPVSRQLGQYMYVNLSADGQLAAVKNFRVPDDANFVKVAIISWGFTQTNDDELQPPELRPLLAEGVVNVCGGEVYTVSYTTGYQGDIVFHASAYNAQGDLLDISYLTSAAPPFLEAGPPEEPGGGGEGVTRLHIAAPPDAIRIEYALAWDGSGEAPQISNVHIFKEESLLSPEKAGLTLKIFPYLAYRLDLWFYSSKPTFSLEMAFDFPSPTGRHPIGPQNFNADGKARLVHDVFAATALVAAPPHGSGQASSLQLFITPPDEATELTLAMHNNVASFIQYKIEVVGLLEERLDGVHDINAVPFDDIKFASGGDLGKFLAHIVGNNIRNEDKKGLIAVLDHCHKKGWLTSAAVAAGAVLSLPTPDPAVVRKARAILGEARELGVGWIPDLGEPAAPKKAASSPLRVAHFFKTAIPYEHTGGSIRCANIVKFQKKVGLDPLVVLPLGYPEQNAAGDLFHMYEYGGVPHYQITPFSFQEALAVPADKRTWADSVLAYELLKDKDISLIQASSGYRGYEQALKGLAVARKLGVPFVYEVRSFHEHTWIAAEDWVLEAELTRMRIERENACMRNADAVVTICETMKQELIKRGLPAEKIAIVPNSVDERIFYPRAADTELKESLGLGDKWVVGYISNLSKREGHEVLLRAVALLRETRQDIACLIVGEGPQLDGLRKLAEDLGVADLTVFTGGVPHEDIAEYYALIDVFVVPRIQDYASDYVTPMKPVEAMAMKKPIIASDRPALRELLGDDRGLLFEAGDHLHLTDRIGMVLDDEHLRDSLAERGYNWILDSRTWDKTIERYSELYADILR